MENRSFYIPTAGSAETSARLNRVYDKTAVAAGAFLWFFLSLALPIGFALGLKGPRWNWGAAASLFVILYCGCRLAMQQLHGEARLVSICFWLFSYTFLGLVPLLQFLQGGSFPWGEPMYSSSTVILAYTVILGGLIAFDAGWFFSRWYSGRAQTPAAVGLFSRQLSGTRLNLFVIAAIAVSIAMVQFVGGLDSLFVSRVDMSQQIATAAGGEGQTLISIWSALLRTPSAAAFLCLLAFWSGRWRYIGPLGLFLVFASASCVLLISNPMSTARFWVGTLVLATFFITARWSNRFSVCLVGVFIPVCFAILFPFADAFRATVDVNLKSEMSSASIVTVLTNKADFDSLQQGLNSIEFVRSDGLQHGRQLLGSLLFWVPRSLWESKPEATGALVASSQGYTFRNLALPLWFEVYIDGGLLLVFVIFCIYGAVANRVEERFLQARRLKSAALTTVLVPVFAPYQFFLLRGSLMPAIAYLVPLLICILITTAGESRVSSPAKRSTELRPEWLT